MPRSDPQFVVRRGDVPVEESRYHDKESTFSASFLIILVSLLFVSVLGGALVGGVVSGNPSNEFFIAILCASGVAIGVAAIVGIRYWCKQRGAHTESGDIAVKHHGKRDIRGDIRGTITRTLDEDEEVGYYDNRGRYYPAHGEVQEKIEEVEAQSMAPGDISAMSPGTYDHYAYADQTKSQYTRSEYIGNGYRLRINPREEEEFRPSSFDFESVISKQSLPIREDPPEDVGCNVYAGMPLSKDPAAAIVRADGTMIFEEAPEANLVDPYSPLAMSEASRSTKSRYYVEDDEEATAVSTTDDERRDGEDKKKRERPKSPGKDRKNKDTLAPPPPPPPPRRTISGSTPTSSEAGSAVSSLFLKPFAGIFGKKRTTSEAGYSDASTNIKGSENDIKKRGNQSKNTNPSGNEGKPPMPGRKNNDEKHRGLSTITGGYIDDRNSAPTPGNNSTFSIPPPRRVPSTPQGSEAQSEFRSMAGSSVFSTGVASSTFDQKAHERALLRTQKNAAALGATFKDMPIYYEDNESTATSVAPSAAPSEPTARSIGYDVFAPPGPIGIVVDTIDKGCIVHSLKKTSPMQGLINPGDLIVALDDFDVRQMDAASLTKLMAKKSQQKQRKFTLIPAEEY